MIKKEQQPVTINLKPSDIKLRNDSHESINSKIYFRRHLLMLRKRHNHCPIPNHHPPL